MPKDERLTDKIEGARQRVQQAEQCVLLIRAISGDAPRGTIAEEIVQARLLEFERSLRCRRLELTLLMRRQGE